MGSFVALCCVGGIVAFAASNGGKPNADSNDLVGPPATSSSTEPSIQHSTAPAPEPADTLPPGSITDQGTLLVGPDIKPGTYVGFGPCYWARLKNADGDIDSILANDNAGSEDRVTVTISKSDYAFEHGCGTLIPLSALRAVPTTTKPSDAHGVLVIGKDIHAGTWRGTALGSCYWARLSGFSGGFDHIIANDNVTSGAKFTINVKATDKGLSLGGDCGPLTKA